MSAEVLNKLLGIVHFQGVSQGWLVITAPLTKDGEGFKKDWVDRLPHERDNLLIYDPPRLLELLTNARHFQKSEDLSARDGSLTDEWVLLVSNYGDFWCNIANVGGIPDSIRVFDARSGEPVTDEALIQNLRSTNTSLSSLKWEVQSSKPAKQGEPALDVIVEVAQGESWFDYRPSRPEDFVGRKSSLKEITDFLESVRSNSTRTRLFSVCSLSGWGKSSLVNKFRAICGNNRNKSKFFVFPVDVRAAESPSYVQMALLKAFQAAIDRGSLNPSVLPLQTGHGLGTLTTDSMQDCLEQLRNQKKVLVLFLDQFEEVLSSPEHSELFKQFRSLSLEVDGQQSGLVLGFAWKTDATLLQEHPAYFLWQEMADRRFDVTLPRFTDRDVLATLNSFGRQLGQQLIPVLRIQLAQSCQGYPWLLKKLCIHVHSLIEEGQTQSQIIESGLAGGGLFDSDLVGL